MFPFCRILCIGGAARSWTPSQFWVSLELQYWVLSVLLNPSLSQGVLHWWSMWSWSKVMYRCSVVSIFSETDCLHWVVCWPHSMPSTCNRQFCGTVVHIQLANETVASFTCAILDIGGWCTVKHRYFGYHVACPPWLLYWSKGVLCSELTLFLWLGGQVSTAGSKKIYSLVLLCSNAWHFACVWIWLILATGFCGCLDQWFLLFWVLA